MEELAVVRVVALKVPNRRFDGTEGVSRPPQVGDIGTIVHKVDELCIVEAVDKDGYTIWLADFSPDEVEEVVFRVNKWEKLMGERVDHVTAEIAGITQDVRATFGELSGEQLNWKPGEGKWSIAQCLDHLIKSNSGFASDFAKLADGGRKSSFFEKYSPLSGVMGRFLIKAVTDDSKKAKAPTKKVVPPSDLSADIVDTFCSHLASIGKKIEPLGDVDPKKTILTSPILAIFTYSLDDAYTVIVEHSKRHVRQAKRVMESADFPR